MCKVVTPQRLPRARPPRHPSLNERANARTLKGYRNGVDESGWTSYATFDAVAGEDLKIPGPHQSLPPPWSE